MCSTQTVVRSVALAFLVSRQTTLIVLEGHSYEKMASVLELLDTDAAQPVNPMLTAVTTVESASQS